MTDLFTYAAQQAAKTKMALKETAALPAPDDNLPPTGENIPEYTVSELSQGVKKRLETGFSYIRVRGEISGFRRTARGHLYFTLKDEHALVQAVCWRGQVSSLQFYPEDGIEVRASGKLTTYSARSQYQLVVEDICPYGEGALLQLVEKRKQKLAAEGLFADHHKKRLPFLPGKIGVITSPGGAVWHDILHRLEARCPCEVILWPVQVQGNQAVKQVIAALQGFAELVGTGQEPDLLILARGGGSIEDLLPFQDEDLVRAIHACPIPIIAAIGHETDYALAEMVADRRAPTPSAAAEMAVPVRQDLLQQLIQWQQRLSQNMRQYQQGLQHSCTQYGHFFERFSHFLEGFQQNYQNASHKLPFLVRQILTTQKHRVLEHSPRLNAPIEQFESGRNKLAQQGYALHHAFTSLPRRQADFLQRISQTLQASEIRYQISQNNQKLLIRDTRLQQIVQRYVSDKQQGMLRITHQLPAALPPYWAVQQQKLAAISHRLLQQKRLQHQEILALGYALIKDGEGKLLIRAKAVTPPQDIQITFQDGVRHGKITS